MIIRYPTGLYASVLPAPDEYGNVTFTISSTDPPRSALQFHQIPDGIANKHLDRQLLDKPLLRENLGPLAFTVSRSTASETGSGTKQFEIGEVLEFGDAEVASISPMLISSRTEIRHDTNVLDYDALGITDDELEAIKLSAHQALEQLEVSLNEARQNRANVEIDINKNQKAINETSKAIAALETLSEIDPSVLPTVEKLQANLGQLQATRDELMEKANSHAMEAEAILNKMRRLMQVVR